MVSRRILDVISPEYPTPWKTEVDFIGACIDWALFIASICLMTGSDKFRIGASVSMLGSQE
jgi:hypothetical protein